MNPEDRVVRERQAKPVAEMSGAGEEAAWMVAKAKGNAAYSKGSFKAAGERGRATRAWLAACRRGLRRLWRCWGLGAAGGSVESEQERSFTSETLAVRGLWGAGRRRVRVRARACGRLRVCVSPALLRLPWLCCGCGCVHGRAIDLVCL